MAEEDCCGFTDSEIQEQRAIIYTKVIQNIENDIEVLESASSKLLFILVSFNYLWSCVLLLASNANFYTVFHIKHSWQGKVLDLRYVQSFYIIVGELLLAGCHVT